MERVRPWWSPPVPGISWFPETNVRTYLRHTSGVSGVWFFSLEAHHRLAVSIARRFWHLPYVYSHMTLQRMNNRLVYTGHRPGSSAGHYCVEALLPESQSLQVAAPETLEHFLLERYTLLARRANGTFFSGQVYHEPYQYQLITQSSINETLLAAAGLNVSESLPPVHVAYSPGVDVRIGALRIILDDSGNSVLR